MALASLRAGVVYRGGAWYTVMAWRYTVAGVNGDRQGGVILALYAYGGIYAQEWRGAFFMACIWRILQG